MDEIRCCTSLRGWELNLNHELTLDPLATRRQNSFSAYRARDGAATNVLSQYDVRTATTDASRKDAVLSIAAVTVRPDYYKMALSKIKDASR